MVSMQLSEGVVVEVELAKMVGLVMVEGLHQGQVQVHISKIGILAMDNLPMVAVPVVVEEEDKLEVHGDLRPVRLAYQPPASSTFLSEQTSHQQPASSTLLSEQTSTSHQPPANRTGC
jgi:hypothetical protein